MPIQGGIRVAMNRIKSPCDRTQGPKPRVTTLLLGKTILSLLLLTSISPDAQAEPHRFQYYRPILILCAHSQNQSKLEDKFGGIPHGFPVKKWPCCSGCRRPMSLLAQLVHSKERLDLGGKGRVLYIFMCNTFESDLVTLPENDLEHQLKLTRGCSSGSASFGRGANSVVVLEAKELLNGTTTIPRGGNLPLPELRVAQWQAGFDESPLQYTDYLDRHGEVGPISLLSHMFMAIQNWEVSPDGHKVVASAEPALAVRDATFRCCRST